MKILQKTDYCMPASLIRPRLLISTTNSALAIITLAIMAIRVVWTCLPVPTTPHQQKETYLIPLIPSYSFLKSLILRVRKE
jgi:hypothetical protein